MIYRAPRSWEGKTCIILAGGPSLKGVDLSLVGARGEKVIAINDSWKLRPYAHVLYFCDAAWWQRQQAANGFSVDRLVRFHDLIYKGFFVKGGAGFEDHPQVRQLRFTGQVGLETDPSALRHGSNSGYQAINLAYHFGASKIVLLGYDMKCAGDRTHWHGDGVHGAETFANTLAREMLPLFDHLVAPLAAAGIEVVNATPDSALTCWPHLPLGAALEEATISRLRSRLPGSAGAARRRLRP